MVSNFSWLFVAICESLGNFPWKSNRLECLKFLCLVPKFFFFPRKVVLCLVKLSCSQDETCYKALYKLSIFSPAILEFLVFLFIHSQPLFFHPVKYLGNLCSCFPQGLSLNYILFHLHFCITENDKSNFPLYFFISGNVYSFFILYTQLRPSYTQDFLNNDHSKNFKYYSF